MMIIILIFTVGLIYKFYLLFCEMDEAREEEESDSEEGGDER